MAPSPRLPVLFAFIVLLGTVNLAGAAGVPLTAGLPFPFWSEGHLDIHHINTGRGETAFLVLPDGTTLLIDAGAAGKEPGWTTPPRPDDSREPGEWIARYATRMLGERPQKQIDLAMLSHFHGDHMGALLPKSPASKLGNYQLTGITEVAEHLPIRRMFDRNWPDYNWPAPLDDAKMVNYRKFLAWHTTHRGMRVERIEAGRNNQLGLVHHPERYPDFEIRNIAVNGEVWTGVGTVSRNHFPPVKSLHPRRIGENKCSIALRISYGKFDYFTGGDLDVRDVELAGPADQWMDIERPVALVTGPVEVFKANHHANYDANSPFFLSVLRPRVTVACTWGASQPAMAVHRRFLSQATYAGPRDLFYTNIMDATLKALHIDRLKTPTGHIVVRVLPGGEEYFVCVLDDTDESYRIKAVFGPYQSD